ncbi:hypothetical protein AB0F36_31490 [Streptomyces sp. NPDC029080]|uniref:hypothetical protein n=1 Tax=Streptomyces sp. NPDC029080 TaxID=3155017 RepID=UPI0033F6E1FF
MTGRTRIRLDRVRASVGIAQLALQQIEDDLSADDVNAPELAAILRELQEDIDVPGGLFPMLALVISPQAMPRPGVTGRGGGQGESRAGS